MHNNGCHQSWRIKAVEIFIRDHGMGIHDKISVYHHTQFAAAATGIEQEILKK
jgi:hypothetical protein